MGRRTGRVRAAPTDDTHGAAGHYQPRADFVQHHRRVGGHAGPPASIKTIMKNRDAHLAACAYITHVWGLFPGIRQALLFHICPLAALAAAYLRLHHVAGGSLALPRGLPATEVAPLMPPPIDGPAFRVHPRARDGVIWAPSACGDPLCGATVLPGAAPVAG